ncbi:MAG: hypothetical protein ACI936_001501 [Paraglaciecola sp.]|jgi:hypothetical protein
MNLVAGNVGIKIDLPQINYFPTFAVTALYQDAVAERPDDLQSSYFLRPRPLPQINMRFRCIRAFRLALRKGQRVVVDMGRFTGISTNYWDKANLRIFFARYIKL